MRKAYIVLAVLLVVALLATGLSCAKPKPTQVFTLKWGGVYPPPTVMEKAFSQYFMQRATELSNGALQWEYYPSNQLVGMMQMLDGMGGGTVDAGLVVPAFSTGKIPLVGIQDLPFLFDADIEGHIKAGVNLAQHPDYTGAFEQVYNVKIIGGDVQGTNSFYFKEPLTKVEDFKGRKVRAAGKMQSSAINALGGAAQSLPSPEVYLALQTGVIDGSQWQPISAVANRIYEVADYAVIPYISLSGYFYLRAMNRDVWNSLPKDVQDALMKAQEDTEKNSLKVIPAAEKEAIDTLAQNGMNIYYVPREENLRWRQATRPVWDEWLQKTGAKGQGLLDFVLDELK
jgi:TRAP-type C4-dicarboxylate transport system substrate-binding protein